MPLILITNETVNLEITWDEFLDLWSGLRGFRSRYSSKTPHTNILQLFFCTGFSCTSEHGDIQCRSLCSLLVFALQVTFKWSFHMGSNLIKKSSYSLRKRVGLLFESVPLLVVSICMWYKATLSRPVCPPAQLRVMSQQTPSIQLKCLSFNENNKTWVKIPKYCAVLQNSASAWESYRKTLYKKNKTIDAVSLTKLIEAKRRFPTFTVLL